jgi:acetyl-CoA carboxylase carboxyl transferase subunit alpha
MASRLQAHLVQELDRLQSIPLEEMLEARYERLLAYGN